MSHGNALTQKARYRAHCTGTGHQDSVRHLKSGPPQHPVPHAHRDQARLEAAVFERLDGTIDYCAHPAGVAQVHPEPGRLTVALDPEFASGHSLPEHTLGILLPTQYTGPEETEGPGGIIGVRLRGIDPAGLHLGYAGTDARVT
ncbi:hypothetical protein ACWIGC_28585, partial [Streptomyces diastaticus]